MIVNYLAAESSATESFVSEYAKQHDLHIDQTVIDEAPTSTHWRQRAINKVIHETLTKDSTLLVYEAKQIASSMLQLLEVLEALSQRNIVLHFVKYQQVFHPGDLADTQHFLRLVQDIEHEFMSQRVVDTLAQNRAHGAQLGRPKGRKNKSRKLDKHQDEIKKYLALNLSKASIAKLIGCHPQTLYNYLDEKDLV